MTALVPIALVAAGLYIAKGAIARYGSTRSSSSITRRSSSSTRSSSSSPDSSSAAPAPSGHWIALVNADQTFNEPPGGRSSVPFRVTRHGAEVYRGRYSDAWGWAAQNGGGTLEWLAADDAASSSVGGWHGRQRARRRARQQRHHERSSRS